MGVWTLESFEMSDSERNDTGFGNQVIGVAMMKYTPSRFGSFVDVPKLKWFEIILMVDHIAKTWWVHEGNQYLRNPKSPTLEIWLYKYYRAYQNAAYGDADSNIMPLARLFDKNRNPLTKKTFSDKTLSEGEMSQAVRSYLKSNGGFLKIVVRDTPAVIKATNGKTRHVERLLQFHCGVDGMGSDKKYEQYLVMDSTANPNTWTRICRPGWQKTVLIPTGYKEIDAPADVTVDKLSSARISPSKGEYL